MSLFLHCTDGLPAGRARGRVGMKALPFAGWHCPPVEVPALLPSGVAWSQPGGPSEKLPTLLVPHSFPRLLPANRLPGLPSPTPHQAPALGGPLKQ